MSTPKKWDLQFNDVRVPKQFEILDLTLDFANDI